VTTPTTKRPAAGAALVAFETFFGNTGHIADAIATGLRLGGWTTEVLDVAELDDSAVEGIDLVVVGAPTHAFSLSRPQTRQDAAGRGGRACYAQRGMREWLAELPAPEGRLAATFDTRVSKVRHLPASAARSAARILRSRGYLLVAKPAGFIVRDVEGPLESRQMEHAIAWGRVVAREAELARTAARIA
jgi:hypothetical protein